MNVKLLVMDVDGTLTDGRIYVGAQGEGTGTPLRTCFPRAALCR